LRKKKKRHKIKSSPGKNPQPNPAVIPQDNSTRKVVTKAEFSGFRGPIPPPELLTKYDEIISNGADRILKMAENQSGHRQYIEKWAVIGGTILSYVGVLCAGIIALGALYIGYLLIREQHAIPGTIFGSGGVVGLVTAFIYGTRSRREERERRDQRNRELIRQK
jgi:uncharacterized membrane protein